MNWRITVFKPVAHEVRLICQDTGKVLDLVIPEEHRASSALKNAWLKEQARLNELEQEPGKIETEIKDSIKIVESTPSSRLFKIIAAQALLILILAYLLFKRLV